MINSPFIYIYIYIYIYIFTYVRKMTRGGALWTISRLAGSVPSVVHKSALPRVLAAKRDLVSQCIRRCKFAVGVFTANMPQTAILSSAALCEGGCLVLHPPMQICRWRIYRELAANSHLVLRSLVRRMMPRTASTDANLKRCKNTTTAFAMICFAKKQNILSPQR